MYSFELPEESAGFGRAAPLPSGAFPMKGDSPKQDAGPLPFDAVQAAQSALLGSGAFPSPGAVQQFAPEAPFMGHGGSGAAPTLLGSGAGPFPPVGIPDRDKRPDCILGRPLRVAHVSTCLVQGGIEQWLMSLIRFADPNRLQVIRCVATSDFVDERQVRRLGVPFESGRKESVQRACRDCDVLLVSDPGEIADWVKECPPPLCVMVAHGDSHWTRERLDWMAPVVEHVIAVSERVRQTVCGGFPTSVIPNGIDATRLAQTRPRDEVRSRLGFHCDDFVLGYVGRFAEEKNPGALIDAISVLPPKFRLLLVGYGFLQKELLDEANRKIPGRFAMLREDDLLGDLYASMDAFCLPSLMEGFGLVTLEAMMSGVPVISTPLGYAADAVIDRVNGILVDGSPKSISNAVQMLDKFPEWRQGLVAEARNLSGKTGHARRMSQDYENVLAALWNSKNGMA